MARILVGAAGAVVGFYLGGPVGALQGFTLAYGLSAGLDPNKKILGPKLTDLKAPTASYGAPIAYVEGAPRLAGAQIWASEKRPIEHTATQGGKGGPGVDSTTFTYEQDVLYELAINRCQAIRRVWSNGKLVWTKADDATAASLAASSQTPAWRDIRFYDGAPDQLPDPTYEAAVGIGNAPAYRTRTTVMVEGLNLGGSAQQPVLTFEVLSEAAEGFASVSMATFAQAYGPGSGVTAFSLSAPFKVLVFGSDTDTLSGHAHSYDVWEIDPTAGTATNQQNYPIERASHVSARGVSDESVIVTYVDEGGSYVGLLDMFDVGGLSVQFDLTAQNQTDLRFAKLDDDVVFLSWYPGNSIPGGTLGDAKLRRFSRSTGALAATAASALPGAPNGQAVSADGFVYVLAYSGLAVWKCDLSTLALVDTFVIPPEFGGIFGQIMCDGNTLYVINAGGASLGGTTFSIPWIRWDGAAWELLAYDAVSGAPYPGLTLDPTPTLSDVFRDYSTYGTMNVVDGTLFSQSPPANTLSLWYLTSSVAIVLPTLDQVVRRLCLRTDILLDADIDVTDLSHDVAIADGFVRAMAVSQVVPIRSQLETLASAYLFDAVEGYTLKFVRRGAASVITIPYEDMGASGDGKAEPLPIKRSNDIEIAARVSIRFANTLNDFQDGLEAADRLVTESTSDQVTEVALGFEPGEAKKLADCNTMDLAVSLVQIGPVALPRKYSALEPTDVITLTDLYGDTFRARIEKGTLGEGRLAFDLKLDDSTVINSAAATDESYVASTLVRPVATTDLELLDIPILRDADNGPGFYAAFGASGNWQGAELDSSLDNVTYTKLLDVSDVATLGEATTTLGDFPGGNVFDEERSLTVDVGDGELSSSTRDALLAAPVNALLVGAEIIQFRNAALSAPGVYVLSGLLRGRRGTEWAMADHAADERVVLLQTFSGIRRVSENVSDLNVPSYYKAVTFGRSRSSVAGELFTDTGVALKPFAPVDFRYDPLSSAPTITWSRRSRLSGRFLATTAPPLGEESEAYDVEHRNSAGTLLESATVATASFSATAVGAGDYVTVWQLSAVVGRGYPAVLLLGVQDTPFSPSPGSVVIAGLAPAIGLTASATASPGAGAITIAGQTPAAALSTTASPGAGSITLAGQAPTITVAAPASAWDPAVVLANGSTIVLSNNNHTATSTGGATTNVRGTAGYQANDAGDHYFEITYSRGAGAASDEYAIGIGNAAMGSLYPGATGNGFSYQGVNGQKLNGGNAAYGSTYTTGDIIGVRLNNGVLSFYKNGVSQGNAFTLATFGFTTTVFYPCVGQSTSTGSRVGVLNTGDSAFFSLPAGASAWG